MRTFASSVFGSDLTGFNVEFYPGEQIKLRFLSQTGLPVTTSALTVANYGSQLWNLLRRIATPFGESTSTLLFDFEVGIKDDGTIGSVRVPPMMILNFWMSSGRYYPVVKVDLSGAEITQGIDVYGYKSTL